MNAPDPLFGDAMTNPQRWNRYTYVVNNPLGFIDPSGMDDMPVFKVTIIGYYREPSRIFGSGDDLVALGPGGWSGGWAGFRRSSGTGPSRAAGARRIGRRRGRWPAASASAEKKKSPPDTRLIEAAPLSTESCGSRYWGVTGSAGLLAGRSWSLAIPFLSRANVVSKTDTYGPFASLGGGVERVFVLDWAGHNGVGSEISAGIGPVGVTLSFNNGAHLNAVGISLGWSLLAGSLWVGPTTTTISCR